MSTYTMQLRALIEQPTQFQEGLSYRERIEIGRKHLFDFDYPIFDEEFKKTFETDFIREFYTREIGFETEELFKFKLETWLNINMPYYNKMFESTLIKYNPLENSRMETEHTQENNTQQFSSTIGESEGMSNESTTGQATDDNFRRNLTSDNPDSRLAITTNDGQGVIEYASSIEEGTENNQRNTTGESNSTTESSTSLQSDATQNSVEDYIQKRVGKVGVMTYSKMIQEYRNALIRVERMIFDDMQELFMLVY